MMTIGSNLRSVNNGDEICVTITCNGRVVANVSRTQFSSMDEVLGFVYAMRRPQGMSQLTIRNRTQGWSTMRSIASYRRA